MKKLFFTVALFAATCSTGQTQENVFNARLKLRKVNCNDKQVQMDVEIRSLQTGSSFYLGDANFRFGYDGNFLRRPVISQQPNFSHEAAVGGEYGSQNLNGSSENMVQGLLSLNVFYTGTGAKPQKVTPDWMTIATIQFDIVNTRLTTPSQLVWYTAQTFPKSGLSEVVAAGNEFQLKAVKSGIFTNTEIPVIADMCPNLSSGSVSGPSTVPASPITNPSPPGATVTYEPAPGANVSIEDGDLIIPDGFSPNGDGINDVFVLRNKKGVKVSLHIYNRLGVLVYSSANYQNDWNGHTEAGNPLVEGTYFYVIKSADGQHYRKALTLMR